MNKSAIPVTVVLPVKNEASNLRDCLPRLCNFHQVIVVDSTSTDETKRVVAECGATYLNFFWDGSFPKKRNWTLRNFDFNTEWILFLDADEFITPEFEEELRKVLPMTAHNAFWLSFNNYFQGRLIKHGISFMKTALLRRGCGEYEKIDEERWSHLDMEIHEHLVVKGSVGTIKSPIEHRDMRSIRHYIAKHEAYADWEMNRYFKLFDTDGNKVEAVWKKLTKRQRKKYENLIKWWFAPAYFFMHYIVYRGFLDGVAGFRFALLKYHYFRMIRNKIVNFQIKR